MHPGIPCAYRAPLFFFFGSISSWAVYHHAYRIKRSNGDKFTSQSAIRVKPLTCIQTPLPWPKESSSSSLSLPRTKQPTNHLASRGSLPIPLPCSWTINVLRFVFSSSFRLPFELIERPANQTQYGFCNHQSNCVPHNELTSSQTTTWAWLQTEDSTHRGKDSPNREDDEPVQTYWRDSLNIRINFIRIFGGGSSFLVTPRRPDR